MGDNPGIANPCPGPSPGFIEDQVEFLKGLNTDNRSLVEQLLSPPGGNDDGFLVKTHDQTLHNRLVKKLDDDIDFFPPAVVEKGFLETQGL